MPNFAKKTQQIEQNHNQDQKKIHTNIEQQEVFKKSARNKKEPKKNKKEIKKEKIKLTIFLLSMSTIVVIALIILFTLLPRFEFELDSQGENYKIVGMNGYFSEGIVEIPSTYKGKPVTNIGEYAFGYRSVSGKQKTNDSLTTIIIPNSITTIAKGAFENCTALKKVQMTDGLVKIEESAFKNCTALENIEIPNTTNSVSTTVFYGCTALQEIKVNEENTEYKSIEGVMFNKNVTYLLYYPVANSRIEYEIPSTVKVIHSYSFYKNSTINEIILPENLSYFGEYCFADCENLTTINFPNKMLNISQNAFENCKNLKNITLGTSLSTIKSNAFKNCTALENVILPESLIIINDNAFYGCEKIKSIIIPLKVTNISATAFDKCSGLENIYAIAQSKPEYFKDGWSYNASITWNYKN